MKTQSRRPPVRVFYSYAHEDAALRDALDTHLSQLRRDGVIQAWHDREITAGRAWEDAIDQHLEAAELILLLISPDFLHSDYCYDREMRRALARHDAGEAWVVPIHLRPVDWEGAPFARLQALPPDARPVTDWPDRDQAFTTIAQGIRRAAQAIRRTPSDAPIAHAPLEARRRRWSRVVGVLAVLVLLAAAAVGWYGYDQHAKRLARHLDDGHEFLKMGDYARAEEAYQQALALSWWDTRAARLGLEKARVFEPVDGRADLTVVQQRIKHILAQSPDDAHAALFQGDLHATVGAYEQAQPWYERAVTRDPTLAHGYFRLGVIFDKLGQRDLALKHAQRAVELADKHQPYLINLAYQYVRHHDYDNALAWYHQAWRLDADYLVTYVDLARLHRARGEPETAVGYLEKGVSLLEDKQIATLPINQEPWYVSLGEEHLPLDTLPQKRCYAYRSLAATLRALERRGEADAYQRKPCGLDRTDERTLQAWVEAESRAWDGAPPRPRP